MQRNTKARAARIRKKVRLQTVKEWRYRCACGGQLCGEAALDWRRLQIHEEPPRAHGGNPLDKLDCVPLSGSCHTRRTGELGKGKTLWIEIMQPTRRCRGILKLTAKQADGSMLEIYVEPPTETREAQEL